VNESRDIKKIEQVYSLITENEDNKVWKSGDCPEALGDSELAGQLKPDDNTPEGAEKAVTPEGADEDNAYYMKKISERLKENKEKTGKIAEGQINNSTIMSNEPKNIFDKLYSTIMEGDDPFADLGGMGDEDMGGGDEFGDEELDIGGDEITLSLPRDLAEKLHEALMDQLSDGDDDEMGDEEGDDPFGGGDDEMLGDSVVSEPDPKPLGGHGDRSHPYAGNKSNKVKSSKTGSTDGGSADGGTVKEDPDPKPLGGHGDRSHPDAGNTGSGSNKVNNPKSKAIGD
jgi:hypothetical protein